MKLETKQPKYICGYSCRRNRHTILAKKQGAFPKQFLDILNTGETLNSINF